MAFALAAGALCAVDGEGLRAYDTMIAAQAINHKSGVSKTVVSTM